MKKILLVGSAIGLFTIGLVGSAAATNVSGTSDPWLSGMPNGSTASWGDSAPDQSPVSYGAVVPGTMLTFSVTGSVNNDPVPSGLSPDGTGFQWHLFDSTTGGPENGIAGANVPLNALVGVFLMDAQPDLSSTPGALDFSILTTSFTSLSPELKQVFFIGDGLTGTGTGSMQQFFVPTGATRLFLGTMDGFGWYNNYGSFDVDVTVNAPVPEPDAMLLFGTGVAGLAAVSRRKRS